MESLRERAERLLKKQQQEELRLLKNKEIEKPVRTKIEVKMTEEEKQLIRIMAQLNHMDMSTFMRYLALTKYADEMLSIK